MLTDAALAIVRMPGWPVRHIKPRACRGADFRRIVDDFNQHQLGSALTHSRSHMGSGQLVNQEIGCRNEVDKPLAFIRQFKIEGNTFFAGIQKLMERAALEVLAFFHALAA